jgi:hypothetical protein
MVACIVSLLITNSSFPEKIYPEQVRVTLYVDRSFDATGQDNIIQAAHEWAEATNHIVEYRVVMMPTTEKIDLDNSIFISPVSPDFPEIFWRDRLGNTILGIYFGHSSIKTIILVPERLDEYTYKLVCLHELGHSLGLEHSGPEEWGTLMYPIVDFGGRHITKPDLIQFCKLYHCDADKLKH